MNMGRIKTCLSHRTDLSCDITKEVLNSAPQSKNAVSTSIKHSRFIIYYNFGKFNNNSTTKIDNWKAWLPGHNKSDEH